MANIAIDVADIFRQVREVLTDLRNGRIAEKERIHAAELIVYRTLSVHPVLDQLHPPPGKQFADLDYYTEPYSPVGWLRGLAANEHFRSMGLLGETGVRARIMVLLLWVIGHRLPKDSIPILLSMAFTDAAKRDKESRDLDTELLELRSVKDVLVSLQMMIKNRELPLHPGMNPFLGLRDENEVIPHPELDAYSFPKDLQYEYNIYRDSPYHLFRPLPGQVIIPRTKLTMLIIKWLTENFGLGNRVFSQNDINFDAFWNANLPFSQRPQDVVYYLNTKVTPLGSTPPSEGIQGFDVHASVKKLSKAMDGIGTTEAILIQTVTPLSAMNMDILSSAYRRHTGNDLCQMIENETSGRLQDVLTAVVRGPIGYDVYLLQNVFSSTTEKMGVRFGRIVNGVVGPVYSDKYQVLTEIIADRSPQELSYLGQAYRAKCGRRLEEEIRDHVIGKTEQTIFTSLLLAERPTENTPVEQAQVEIDAVRLYNAGEGRIGTNESIFCNIIVSSTRAHLTALWNEYKHRYCKSLSKVIKSEFSGHMKDTLLYITAGANPKRIEQGPGVWRDAKLLEVTMKGLGTNDHTLIRRLVRTHWDPERFGLIKHVYSKKYKRTLEERVTRDTSGNYRKACLGIVGGTLS